MNKTNDLNNDTESGDLSRARPKVVGPDGQAAAGIAPADRDDHDQTVRRDAERIVPLDGDNVADIRPGSSVPNTADIEEFLDDEHQRIVDGAVTEDAPADQARAARDAIGRLTRAIAELLGESKEVGSAEYLAATVATGRCPWAKTFRLAAWLAMLGDAALWFWFWRRVLVASATTAALVAATLTACAGKVLGWFVSTTRFVHPTSGRKTVETHERILKGSVLGVTICGILFGATLLVASLGVLTANGTKVLAWIGNGLLFAVNLGLGFSSGVARSLSRELMKPALADAIDYQFIQKKLARTRLVEFVKALVLGLTIFMFAGWSSPARSSEPVYVVVVDDSSSLHPDDRTTGIRRIAGQAAAKAWTADARWVLAMRVSNERTLGVGEWIAVPQRLSIMDVDCTQIEPPPPQNKAESIYVLMRGPDDARREEFMTKCELDKKLVARSHVEELTAFEAALTAALSVAQPRDDTTTHLIELIERLTSNDRIVAADILTDGWDNSRESISQLVIPERVQVRLILTRPNPKRSLSIHDVWERAQEWGRVPRLDVLTVSELGPAVQ